MALEPVMTIGPVAIYQDGERYYWRCTERHKQAVASALMPHKACIEGAKLHDEKAHAGYARQEALL